MKRAILGLLLVFNLLGTSVGAEPKEADLCSPDVATMLAAGDRLCHLEEASVPFLIRLLDTDERIFPTSQPGTGGAMYIGHGGCPGCYPFLFYGLNETQVRAGWMLERITFQDFGFSCDSALDREPSKEVRQAAVARARAWWQAQPRDWRRVDGIRTALMEGSPWAQRGALDYLLHRNRDGDCASLTESSYFEKLHPVIADLFASPVAEVREKAAEVWLRVEFHQPGQPLSHLIPKSEVAQLTRSSTWEWTGNGVVHEGRVAARVGDPLSQLTAEVPVCWSFDNWVALETVPTMCLEVEDGKITYFWDLGKTALPWEPRQGGKS